MIEQGQTRECPPQFGTALKTKRKPPRRAALSSIGIDTGLAARFALLHEGVLRGAGERLAFGTHGFGGAAIGHALLHERGLGSTGERLAVLADGLGVTAFLRKSDAAGKRDDQTSLRSEPRKQYSLGDPVAPWLVNVRLIRLEQVSGG